MLERTGRSRYRHELKIARRGDWKQLVGSLGPIEHVMLSLGQAAYEVENELAIDGTSIRRLELVVGRSAVRGPRARLLSRAFQRVLSYIVLVTPRVSIVGRDEKKPASTGKTEDPPHADVVHLFSGGVDSLVGISEAIPTSRVIHAVYCAHEGQAHLTAQVRRMARDFLTPRGITFWEVPVPKVTVGGYSQTRGFMYMLAGLAVARVVGAGQIYVNECGPTMYQPRFAAIDQITMTTHPFVIERARDVAGILTDSPPELVLPFEDATKAEMMAACRDASWIPKTYSCVSQRLGRHDGTCFGCVVRRLAALAAGVPDVNYQRNPLTDLSASVGNLLSVVEFCGNMLASPKDLADYSIHLVAGFDKWGLFHRWSLDTFAAIQRLLDAGSAVIPPVLAEYRRVVRKHGVGFIRDRLRELDAHRGADPRTIHE